MFETLTIIALLIGVFVTLLFLLSVVIGRNDIADIAWGSGVLSTGLIAASLHELGTLSFVVLCVAICWGVRLSVRIFLRNVRKSEDPRYRAWRESWGRWLYPRSFLQIYVLQGFLMIVVGYPLVHAVVYGGTASFGVLQYIGLCVWCIGYVFEVVGDYQLDTYLRQPIKERPLLDTGLWAYSRHPNYFGEVTMWWGIWLMIATLPMSWIALIGPITITFLILKVSGIPMLEARFAGNPAFEAYKKRTSAFFPLPPRKVDAE